MGVTGLEVVKSSHMGIACTPFRGLSILVLKCRGGESHVRGMSVGQISMSYHYTYGRRVASLQLSLPQLIFVREIMTQGQSFGKRVGMIRCRLRPML